MDQSEKKKTHHYLDTAIVVVITLILCASLLVNVIICIKIQQLSHSSNMIKQNILTEKATSYDIGSSSFLGKKIEVTKKDNRDGNVIKGELINRSGQRIAEATIYFKLYDKNGDLIKWTADRMVTWDSGEKWTYEAPVMAETSKYEFSEIIIKF